MTTIETSELHPEHSATVEIPSFPSVNVDTNTPPIPSENPEIATEDPKVAALQAMFPDFDATVLHTILESVSEDQDRAIDVLLGMSDPSYQPTARPDAVSLYSKQFEFTYMRTNVTRRRQTSTKNLLGI